MEGECSKTFELHKRNDNLRIDPGADVRQELKVAANTLVHILRLRFNIFRKRQIREKSRRDHWSMHFASRICLVLLWKYFKNLRTTTILLTPKVEKLRANDDILPVKEVLAILS